MLRCSYVFPDGRPCRCLARRQRSLCRHHTAEAFEARALRADPPPAEPEDPDAPIPRSEYAAYWRSYHGVIRQAHESQFDEIVANLIGGLDAGLLSTRSAGRLLFTLVQRRRLLYQQWLQQHLLPLDQRAAPRPASTSAIDPLGVPAPQVNPPLGHQRNHAMR